MSGLVTTKEPGGEANLCAGVNALSWKTERRMSMPIRQTRAKLMGVPASPCGTSVLSAVIETHYTSNKRPSCRLHQKRPTVCSAIEVSELHSSPSYHRHSRLTHDHVSMIWDLSRYSDAHWSHAVLPPFTESEIWRGWVSFW